MSDRVCIHPLNAPAKACDSCQLKWAQADLWAAHEKIGRMQKVLDEVFIYRRYITAAKVDSKRKLRDAVDAYKEWLDSKK